MPALLRTYEPTEIQIRNLMRYTECKAGEAAAALANALGQWDMAVRALEARQRPHATARKRARRSQWR